MFLAKSYLLRKLLQVSEYKHCFFLCTYSYAEPLGLPYDLYKSSVKTFLKFIGCVYNQYYIWVPLSKQVNE
jgi:hypothetical protein